MGSYVRHALRDAFLVAISVLFAIIFARSGFIADLNARIDGLHILAAFVSGIFFTSVFTTAPAVVMLGALSQSHDPFGVAAFGALGSLCGDLIMFRFLTDHLSNDFSSLMKRIRPKRLQELGALRAARWLLPLAGALVIASPLPDELGIMILRISRMPNRLFVPLSYSLNFLGILFIGLVAKSLLMPA